MAVSVAKGDRAAAHVMSGVDDPTCSGRSRRFFNRRFDLEVPDALTSFPQEFNRTNPISAEATAFRS